LLYLVTLLLTPPVRTILIYYHVPSAPSLFIFFFLIIPPLPRSTLFPYTTLFRSHIKLRAPFGHGTSSFLYDELESSAQEIFTKPDRKSTRLNSSHVSISYAVFCLKKKKNTTINMINIAHINRY